jgi:hypothetical protein
MDELPELQSDEEVDALLARLRATIAPPVPHAHAHTPSDSATDALSDFLSVQGEATTTIARALKLLAEDVDELVAEGPRPQDPEGPRAQGPGLSSKASSGARGRRPPPQRAGVRVGDPGPGASRSRRERR